MLANHLHWDKVIHTVHSQNTQKVEAESGVQDYHVIQFEANPSMSQQIQIQILPWNIVFSSICPIMATAFRFFTAIVWSLLRTPLLHSSVVEYLPSIYKGLGPILSTEKNEGKRGERNIMKWKPLFSLHQVLNNTAMQH